MKIVPMLRLLFIFISFHLLSFVVTSRAENESCLPVQCVCNLMVIFVVEILVLVLGTGKYTNEIPILILSLKTLVSVLPYFKSCIIVK